MRLMNSLGQRAGLTSKSSSPPLTVSDPHPRQSNGFEILRRIHSETYYQDATEVRQWLSQGDVCLLNATHSLNWRFTVDRTLLWQFQLHYHEFLLPLATSRTPSDTELETTDRELIENTIDSWIDENPVSARECHRDAWHPYCISRRLPVWFCLLTIPELASSVRERMLQSAHDQADFLSRNLEWGLRGNHLLENIRAIALAGCFFDTAASRRWLNEVRRILPAQIDEQVLSHGEHFERSPMYHCQILGNLLEILIVSRNVEPLLDPMIRPVAETMFGFLVEMVHPDGEIPLLGDSCFGESPSVTCLEQLAEAAHIDCPTIETAETRPATTTGPYWIFRDQNDFLIFDRGLAGAQSLPAHAHCDLLTLEASLDGVRWIVDSGINNYEDDPMRWYCRSSLAHNVVCLDDQNQFDIWSKFRMGYRGWPSELNDGQEGDFCWAAASHNAYRRFGLKRLSRLIGIEKQRFWYCLDRAQPNSKRRLTGLLHLGCEVTISRLNENRFLLDVGETTGQLCFYNAHDVKLVKGKYCPEFGVQITNDVIQYSFGPGESPVAGWMLWLEDHNISPEETPAILEIGRNTSADQITISTAEGVIHTFNWILAI